MLTFFIIKKPVMVNHLDNEIKYHLTNPLNLKQRSTILVKVEQEENLLLLIDLHDRSENGFSANILDDMHEKEEEKEEK